jgi:hypothetical protein
MNMLSDAFNKATSPNAFCIRLNQSCKRKFRKKIKRGYGRHRQIVNSNFRIPRMVPYSKDERGSSVAPSLRRRSQSPWR